MEFKIIESRIPPRKNHKYEDLSHEGIANYVPAHCFELNEHNMNKYGNRKTITTVQYVGKKNIRNFIIFPNDKKFPNETYKKNIIIWEDWLQSANELERFCAGLLEYKLRNFGNKPHPLLRQDYKQKYGMGAFIKGIFRMNRYEKQDTCPICRSFYKQPEMTEAGIEKEHIASLNHISHLFNIDNKYMGLLSDIINNRETIDANKFHFNFDFGLFKGEKLKPLPKDKDTYSAIDILSRLKVGRFLLH